MREKKIHEKLMILNLSHGVNELAPQNNEICGETTCRRNQQNSCFQNFRKVEIIKERL